jgi:hypothetical protein
VSAETAALDAQLVQIALVVSPLVLELPQTLTRGPWEDTVWSTLHQIMEHTPSAANQGKSQLNDPS